MTASHTDAPSCTMRLVATAVAVVVLAYVVPFAMPSYLVSQVATALAFSLAVMGLNLVTGYGGAISLGHGAFFAIGAYTSAILMVRHGWHPLATLPAAAALSWIVGLCFGFPALKLQGLYLALGTLVLSITVPPLLKRFDGLTGGVQGLIVGNPSAPAWLGLDDAQWIYFLTLAVAAVLYLMAQLVVTGALGRALTATRDNQLVAAVMGVDRVRLTTFTFALSSLYAGVGGGLYAMIVGFVSPDSFSVMLSLSLFIAVVVGGVTSLAGALWGALFIQFVPVWAGDVDVALAGLVYGATVVIVLLLLPDGIGGALERIGRTITTFARGHRHRHRVGMRAPPEQTTTTPAEQRGLP